MQKEGNEEQTLMKIKIENQQRQPQKGKAGFVRRATKWINL